MKIESPKGEHRPGGRVQFTQRFTAVPLGSGMSSVDEAVEELVGYTDIILGRVDPPIQSPYLGLAECAVAYYSRGLEMEMLIHEAERKGQVEKGSDWYRFRTGALRSFIESMKRQAELGSRRLTQEQVLTEQRLDAGA